MAMAEWAAHVEWGEDQTSDQPLKLDTIQEFLPHMPEDALRDLLLDFWHAGHSDSESAIQEVVDDWYRRALFVSAQQVAPVSPVRTSEDWQKLPDRPLA